MDIQRYWEKALRDTEVIRPRIEPLLTFQATRLPYTFLAESGVNLGDTVVRRGEVVVEKPSLILPNDYPQFTGFDSGEAPAFRPEPLVNFFLVRGVRFPSLKYSNRTHSLDIREGKLREAIEYYRRGLEMQENVTGGLIVGPEDCWQFSVLIFVTGQVLRSAEGDIRKLLDEFRKKKE